MLFAAMLLIVGAPATVYSAEDAGAARVKELLRRTQEALRQAQSDNAALAAGKAEAEQKLLAATAKIDSALGGSNAAKAALQAQLQTQQAAQAQAAQKLGDAEQRFAAAAAKLNETARQLSQRETELAESKRLLDVSKAADTSCEDKNLKLYTYAQAMLERYRNKGVWASLAQKEPVLGLKQVDVDNVVQEYRLKIAAQKINPTP